jgi:hypothetical protein
MLSPNEGIRRSIKNGLLFGLISGLLFGVAMWQVFFVSKLDINIGPHIAMSIKLGFAIFFVLSFMMQRGLGAAVQHYTLRFLVISAKGEQVLRRRVSSLREC